MNQIEQAQRIGVLMACYVFGELSPAEEAELNAWRSLSPKNEQAFQDAIEPERLRADLKAMDEAKKSLFEKVKEEYPGVRKIKPPKQRSIAFRVMKYAAIFILFVCTMIGVITYRFVTADSRSGTPDADQLATIGLPLFEFNSHFMMGYLSGMANLTVKVGENGWFDARVNDGNRWSKKKYYRLFTAKDTRFRLNFHDGTSITLNGNATIKYPTWLLQDSIHVYINGEAYINIPATTKHHYFFKISPPINNVEPSAFRRAVEDKNSRGIQLESEGGTFHLMAYANEPSTTVTLVNGSVRIDSVGGKVVSPIILQPGQQAKLDSGNLNILRPVISDSLWKWKNQ
jgi:ferric-dicitrate binding protein FerR (iron transport regulator)